MASRIGMATSGEMPYSKRVSRPTVTRMYENARRKIADALVNGKDIVMHPVDVVVCTAPRPECANVLHCCHRKANHYDH